MTASVVIVIVIVIVIGFAIVVPVSFWVMIDDDDDDGCGSVALLFQSRRVFVFRERMATNNGLIHSFRGNVMDDYKHNNTNSMYVCILTK
mmetsp:Transcript_25959/g.38882  ORF Transcript_25959/g.38882 Transcript_25959/m.38882 type:complete len:90 (-) Transcript_25959:126-395(-)